ncbi:hypothetical protein SFC82_14945 [Legionella pneumophila]|nr:hypothetical protein [Legionella pneumophila]
MIKYSGIGDQMTTGISDQVLRNTHRLGGKRENKIAKELLEHFVWNQ